MNGVPVTFDLAATLHAIGQAFIAVICRIGFEVAVHGLAVAFLVGILGLIFLQRQHKAGRPLLVVCKKLSIFCGVLALPGTICLLSSHVLPKVNTLQLNSIGLLGFWSLVVLHLIMEEMNFQWYVSNPSPASQDEPATGEKL